MLYLVHVGALPLARGAGDFHGDCVLSVALQGQAVRLQGTEGDLHLWLGEAAGPPVFCGDL